MRLCKLDGKSESVRFLSVIYENHSRCHHHYHRLLQHHHRRLIVVVYVIASLHDWKPIAGSIFKPNIYLNEYKTTNTGWNFASV